MRYLIIQTRIKELRRQHLAYSMYKNNEPLAMPLDCEDKNVSAKVVISIQSYSKIVDIITWGKI